VAVRVIDRFPPRSVDDSQLIEPDGQFGHQIRMGGDEAANVQFLARCLTPQTVGDQQPQGVVSVTVERLEE
jgi:hypothetical protein